MTETNFQMLDELLLRAGAECDAAECHGALAGLACAERETGAEPWIEQVMAELDPNDVNVAECRAAMLQLYAASRADLESGQMLFEPMLPDDEESLSVRAAALGRWCQAFLFGLSLGGLPELSQLPGEVSEIIEDLSELTRAGVDECEEQEESEVAYAELVEFIRVSVQLVHEELNPPIKSQESAPTLH